MVSIPKRNKVGAVMEEENQQTAQGNSTQNSQEQVQILAQKYITQINTLEQQIANKEKEFNDFKAKVRQQILLVKKQAGDNGVLLNSTNESVSKDFSMFLYESLTQDSNIGILCEAIKHTFDSLVGKLSYYYDEKGCLTWAKDLNSWLNDARLTWYRNEDHWNEVAEELNRYMKKSKSRFLDGDCERFIAAFKNELMSGKSKSVFSWIFGNNRVTESVINESFINSELRDAIAEHDGLKRTYARYDARVNAMYDIREAEVCGYISEDTVSELEDSDLIRYIREHILFTNDGGAIAIKEKDNLEYNRNGTEWQQKVRGRNKNYAIANGLDNSRNIYVVPDSYNTWKRRTHTK